MTTALRLWIISDGLPGHVNQSLGIVRALRRFQSVDVDQVDVRLRGKWLRPLMRLTARPRTPSLAGQLFRAYYHSTPLPLNQPDLIVSAGGNTLFANIALSARYQCANLFSGTPKGYDQSLVNCIMTVTPLDNPQNNCVLDLPPANLTPATPSPATTLRQAALLIGGEGAGYHYDVQDWGRLASQLNLISTRDKLRFLITSSRRTGLAAEDALASALQASALAESVWYGREPQRKVVQQFLNTADLIMVTEDSLTMVSEAIYSGRPVITLQPNQMNPNHNDEAALAKYQRLGLIRRVRIAHLHELSLQDIRTVTLPDTDARIHDAVQSILPHGRQG